MKRLLIVLLVLLALPALAQDMGRWSTTAGSNNFAVPYGAPEGWAPSDANNVQRELMAEQKIAYGEALGGRVIQAWPTATMHVYVEPVKYLYGATLITQAQQDLTIGAGGGVGTNRYDRIVMTLSTGVCTVLAGTPGGSPSPPTPVTGTISLAKVYVVGASPATSALPQSVITWERPNFVFATGSTASLEQTYYTNPNILPNPDGQMGTTYWTATTGVTVPTLGAAGEGFYFSVPANGVLDSNTITLTTGTVLAYQFSAKATAGAGTPTVAFVPNAGSTTTVTVTEDGAWHNYAGTFTLSGGAVTIKVTATAGTAEALLFKRTKLELGAISTTWSDEATQSYTYSVRSALFTSSGTWVAPLGVTRAVVTIVGAGGGGGGGSTTSGSGGGGGGSAAGIIGFPITVTPLTSYTVTVAAAPAGGTAGSSNGGDGANSCLFYNDGGSCTDCACVTAYMKVSVAGGGGGVRGDPGSGNGGSAGAGFALNTAGAGGSNKATAVGGAGAASHLAASAAGDTDTGGSGTAGTYGNGGGGGFGGNGTGSNGGAGGSGYVLVRW